MADDGELALAETFAEIARTLLAAKTLEATLTSITDAAVRTIEGCDHACISLIDGRRITTPAASDPVAVAVDAIQYEVDDGPCLDAIRAQMVVHAEDLAQDTRWPLFAARAAAETGVHSMLSFRLFAERDTMGALNLYSKRAGAFDPEADRVGAVLAAHAAVAMVGARHSDQKDEAIRTRDVIGQAKGILMARQGITEDEAFDTLRRASQRMNIKLRDVAAQIARHPGGT